MDNKLTTKLFFENKVWEKDLIAKDYLVHRVKGADPESEFGIKMKDIINAPYETILNSIGIFKQQNYEIMLGYLKDEKATPSQIIAGHMAFQKHSDGWHMFHCYVEPSFRDKGHAHELTEEILKHAKRNLIKNVRFGKKGGHDSMISLLEKLKERYHSSIIDVNLDTHWVELR